MICEPVLSTVFVVFAIICVVWIVKAELKASYYREQAQESFDVLQRM